MSSGEDFSEKPWRQKDKDDERQGLAWSIFAQTMRQELDQAQTGHSRKIQQTLQGKIYTAILHTSVYTYNNVYTCVPEQTTPPPLYL